VHLFLRGDLDGIGNKGMVVAVHDTPGTNNSSDSSHHKVTLDFLSENKMDLILFVLNAEQLGTSDENSLLREIYSNVVKKSKTDVLFILNKIDSIDPEKESLEKMIRDTIKQLEEIGYAKPTVFPVASKAARLLKMKAKGLDTHMTPRERRELALLIHNTSDTLSQLLNATGLPCVERRIEEFLTSKE
jgi:GTPase Era involved in 16S rRNA processing